MNFAAVGAGSKSHRRCRRYSGGRQPLHRSGLDAIEESVIEVSWPARLSSKDLLEARTVAL